MLSQLFRYLWKQNTLIEYVSSTFHFPDMCLLYYLILWKVSCFLSCCIAPCVWNPWYPANPSAFLLRTDPTRHERTVWSVFLLCCEPSLFSSNDQTSANTHLPQPQPFTGKTSVLLFLLPQLPWAPYAVENRDCVITYKTGKKGIYNFFLYIYSLHQYLAFHFYFTLYELFYKVRFYISDLLY